MLADPATAAQMRAIYSSGPTVQVFVAAAAENYFHSFPWLEQSREMVLAGIGQGEYRDLTGGVSAFHPNSI